ncbi:hypothetical protein [uncultured phage cr130_1]|uniref:Uncharacterized protein n=1 Tax=uncultured phage cr130_1 TaxID=2772092 RepID=A0A7M1RVC3_9CAUD|nr:hypothetical protein KNV59_gp66 [uncultured phage cr130_1]QOR57639.1 hypothetical protein [uncultured phage cr130_1]
MTHELTQNLLIEIERRLQTMDPTMIVYNKIETDDLISYFNLFLNTFVKQLYQIKSKPEENKKLSVKLDSYLSTLYSRKLLVKIGDRALKKDCFTYALPDEYLLYIDSISKIKLSYKNNKILTVNNQLVEYESTISLVMNSAFNSGNIIRKPLVVISNGLDVYIDQYSTLDSVILTYIKMPQLISIDNVSYACELPYECFDELVEGTVDLYINIKYKLQSGQKSDEKTKQDKGGDEQ